MSEDPDTHELARRITKLDALFDEMHTIVRNILSWKDRVSGGLTVMIWGIGIIQSVVLVCLGFAANSLNNTAQTLNLHNIELAKAAVKMDALTASREARDAAMKDWVRNEINNRITNQ